VIKTLKNILLVLPLIVNSTEAIATEEATIDLESDLGYFYGYSFGNMLKEGRSTDIDINRLVQGLKDSLAEIPPALDAQQKDAIYSEIKQRQARAQAEQERVESEKEAVAQVTAAVNLQDGEAFLAENAKRAGVRSTASGLQYEVIKEEVGSTARLDSTVVVSYKGTFTTGEVFDQSGGSPVEFGLQQVISGWTEGLQLMSVGDKYRLFLHPNLAYGGGSVGQIPPNSVLVFEVELLEIK